MKKLLAVFFALALAFTAIGTSPAMAAGNNDARITGYSDLSGTTEIYNYVNGKKPLFNSPSDPRIVGYVANQNVTIKQPWFLINTSLGQKWIGFNRWEISLVTNFGARVGRLSVVGKEPIRNDPGSQAVGYVANQTVTVNQAWYLINTSLGEKWIGYNM
ncbi:hypothetical protein [Bacillus wiedmannii]|uniref:hypothetical protein n=1 Tax=Bacillus wiedmannii TaxID=1890302 RepID=UPI000993E582|nr:hypothetical protein [Bacillus wiedmannii]OOR22799.1 hypothetical protein BW893_28760 [Bacillus wiedmannii]PEO19876.1 hypothetical protein CN546_08040 [Bacillus wiedmannii]